MTKFEAPAPRYAGPPNRHGGTGNKPIDRITIHCTVSACCVGSDGIAAMFRTTTRDASAHYVVDALQALQSAWDSWVCYHAPPNEHSLGIEMCCTLSGSGKGHWRRADHQAMLKRTARLTAELCLANDIPAKKLSGKQLRAGERGISGHADVRDAWGETTHWDPGPYFPWRAFIRMVKDEIKDIRREAAAVAAPQPKPQAKPKKLRNTRVRQARVQLNQALDLLAAVPASRKHVKELASHIEDDVHQLPEE